MKLDIQPLDIQPIELDIQPLDIQPLDQTGGYGTAFKQFGADATNAGDTAWSMLAGGLASLAGQTDDADKIYNEMNARTEGRRKAANPENLPLSFPEKAFGMLSTLPAQIPAAMVSPFTTGKEAVDVGETLGTAQKAALVDAAGQAAGFALPMGMAGGLAKRAASGAAINAVQETASKAAIQAMMETEEGKKKFTPTLEDAALAGLTGGAFNAALGRRPTPKVSTEIGDVKFVPKNAEPEVPPTETPALPYTVKDQYGQDIPWNQVDDPALSQGRFNAYADEAGQGNLFAPDQPGMNIKPGEAGAGPMLPEPRGELSNARQMELPEGRDTLAVTPEGVAVPLKESDIPLMAREQQMEAEVARLDAEYELGRQEALLKSEQLELPKTEVQMDLFGDVPVGPIPREAPPVQKATQAVADKMGVEFRDGVPMRKGKPMTDADGKLLPLFKDNKVLAQAVLEQQNIASGGTLMPTASMPIKEWNTWRETFPDKVAQFVEGAAADVNNGMPYNKVMESISDPVIRKQVDKIVEPAMKAPTVGSWQPRGQRLKQGGFINIPGREPQLSPDELKARIPELFPETLPAKDWLAKFATAKDSPRLLNPFTKGGLYQALKTGNPLIKRVTEGIRKAEQQSQAQIRDVVHDSYAPAWRSLSKDEMVKTARLLQEASKLESNVDLNSMRQVGYSDKAIQVVRQHQDAMAHMEGVLGEAARLNGIENVDMRTAHAASMATGDFRRLVYRIGENGEKEVVGILSSNNKWKLNKLVEQYKQKDPSATIGDERFFGGSSRKHGTQEGFSQMLEFLSKNDPHLKDFVNKVNELVSAEDFAGAKKHTMARKGITGMAGDRMQNTPYQNAVEFADSQIRYMENVIQWNNMSKALSDAKEVMGGVDMPNAKQYLSQYIDNALGRNPSAIGKAVDSVMDTVGRELGIGTSMGSSLLSGTKSYINGKLLGLNPIFMLTQIVDPFKAMPAVMQFMQGRGFDKRFDFGTGYGHMAVGSMKALQHKLTGKVDNLTQGALDYANANHVYSSELFDHSNKSRADAGYFWNKGTQIGTANIERTTRQAAYLGYVDMLHSNGIGPKDGLYEAAHNLTDMTMNNYGHTEAPLGYGMFGAAGRMPSNLMSYKHNDLSKLALFAREIPNNGSGRALAAALIGQVVTAGITGTIGFGAADWLTRKISEQMGKPMSLTSLVLSSADGSWADYFRYGMFNSVGLDMTKRMGTEVVGDDLGSLVFPGGSSVVNAGKAVAEAVTDPSEWNVKNAVREVVPNSFGSALDRMWFSPESKQGEMSLSRSTGKATAVRNETDKMWKSIGGTGTNEMTQKTLAYERGQVEKFITDKRSDAVRDMQKALTTGGTQSKDFKDALQRFQRYEGNVANLDATVEQLGLGKSLTPWQRDILRNQVGGSINSANKLRRLGEYGN